MQLILWFISLLLLIGGSFADNNLNKLSLPPQSIANNVAVAIAKTSGQIVFAYRPNSPMLIASNMKLFTTKIALIKLGPDFHWHTKLYYTGQIIDGVLNGDLYLIGGGDPTFSSADLLGMLVKLKKVGVKRIDGKVIIDSRIYNSSVKYSMLETLPYDSDTITPSGFMIDGDETKLMLHANESGGVEITSNLSGYTITNKLQLDTESLCADIYHNITLNLVNNNIIVTGKVANSCLDQTLSYNLLSSKDFIKNTVASIFTLLNLSYTNIEFSDSHASLPPMIMVDDHQSLPLLTILYAMNHYSINLIAESVLLSLGAYTTDNNDSYMDAKNIYYAFLKKYSLLNSQFALENGAGLSRREFMNANFLIKLLLLGYQNSLQNNFQATIPYAGGEGTLQHNFLVFKSRVQFKTGTLNDTRSYAGYFYTKHQHCYVIVAIANKLVSARQKADFEKYVNLLLNQLDQK